MHVFDYWCHLATADSEAALNELMETRASMKLDVATYQLLLKHLGKQAEIIRLG